MINKQKKAIYIKKVHTIEEFYSLKEMWNALVAKSPTDNFFLRWEWLWTWWRVYRGNNYKLCILLVFKGNEVLGIAPLYVIDRLWRNIFTIRRLMFLGTKEGSVISEYMDIIYRAGYEETVIRRIIEFIIEEDLCDVICLHKVETSSKTIPLLQQIAYDKKFLHVVHDKVESPYINLPANWEDFLNSLSGSMRHNNRRNQKRLMKYHNVVFRRTDNISDLKTDFTELVRLHQLRWVSLKLLGAFSSGGRFTLFQKLIMQDMLKNGHLDLRFLSVSGKNIAVLYNIRYNNKIYFYQAGLDVSFDRNLSSGLLLHSYCIKEAIRNGLKEYDFLLMGKMDAYKKRWTKEYRYLCDIYMTRPGIIKFIMSAENKAKTLYHAINRF